MAGRHEASFRLIIIYQPQQTYQRPLKPLKGCTESCSLHQSQQIKPKSVLVFATQLAPTTATLTQTTTYLPPPPPILPQSNQISSYLAIVASLFTVIFVLVGFYVLKVKCYSDWCGRRRNGSFSTQSDSLEDEFALDNQVDHPIWLIATIGLQQSIINSITVCKYKKGDGLIEGAECSVCLNEFQEDETLRLLPKCNHAFHVPCIDTWLRSHVNCPLCRAAIFPNNASSGPAILNLSSMEENSDTVVRNENDQAERNGGELIVTVSENREGTGEAGEAEEFIYESISKERLNVDGNEQVLDETRKEASSASMDSSADHINDDTERHTLDVLKKGGEEYSAVFKSARRSSIPRCLHVTPISMKRSVSCNGRIVSSRGHRSLNSSLPS